MAKTPTGDIVQAQRDPEHYVYDERLNPLGQPQPIAPAPAPTPAPTPAPAAPPAAPVTEPVAPGAELTDMFKNWNIPYQGEDLDALPKQQETSTQTFFRNLVTERAQGKGVELLTPEKVKSYEPFAEEIMAPKYKIAMNRLNESWSAAGRSFDQEKVADAGMLSLKYGAEKASLMLGMAQQDINTINTEIGKALQAGMTFAESDAQTARLREDQAFQLNMYKRKMRDEAVQGLQDEKIKSYYVRLNKAWDNEDWTEYAQLARDLAEAGQPDLADYLMSLIPLGVAIAL